MAFFIHVDRHLDSFLVLPGIEQLDARRFETPQILKKVAAASRSLAEFKGAAVSNPNQAVLINSLGLQEAKDSSAIENIVTTHDELFQASLFPDRPSNVAAKEVQRYRQALNVGYAALSENRLLTNNHILAIQQELEQNDAGFRRVPGTVLKDSAGKTIYTPPDPSEISALMDNLQRFINDDALFSADPLIKMALLHHRFETIHPFYDGNGRTGRIINVLYLVKQELLDTPILYMSRHVVGTKSDYYRLLQEVRDRDAWEEWVLYMLEAVDQTARHGLATVIAIREALRDYKQRIRSQFKFYSQDLINNLFTHPYTKIAFVEADLDVSRLTATKYLDALTAGGFLQKMSAGRSNYYVNTALLEIIERA